MKSHIHTDLTSKWLNTTGAAVVSGQIVPFHGRPAVAITDIAADVIGSLQLRGTFEFQKGTVSFAPGDPVFQDTATAGRVNNGLTNVGVFVGHADRLATSTDAVVRVVVDSSSPARSLGLVEIVEDFVGPVPGIDLDYTGGQLSLVNTAGAGGAPHVSSDEPGGVIKFSFDAVAEAAMVALLCPFAPAVASKGFFCQFRANIVDVGDNAALDINFGVASSGHATNLDLAAVRALFHLDGNDLALRFSHDDGVAVAVEGATLSHVNTLNNWNTYTIDGTNLADVRVYVGGVRLQTASTIDLSAVAAASRIMPIFHVEKTSDNTIFDARVDSLIFRGLR